MNLNRELDRVRVLLVEPTVAGAPRVDDEFESDFALADALRAFALAQPGISLDVVFDSVPPYRLNCHVLRLRDGAVQWGRSEWSVQPDTLEYGPSDRPADVPFDAALTDDPQLAAAFREAGLDPKYWVADDYGGEQVVSYVFHSLEGAVDVFLRLAQSRELPAPELSVRIEVGRRAYGLWLDPVGIELRPLYAWVEDSAMRALLRRCLPEPGPVVARRIDGGRARAADAASPLTTGTLGQRSAAAGKLATAVHSNGALITTAPQRDPAVVAALVAAARDEANQAAPFDPFRIELYEHAAECAAGPAEAASLLVGVLPRESDRVRRRLYALLSNLNDEQARRALVSGFKTEKGEIRDAVGALVWRQPRTVEILVREELVPSWGRDEAWSKAIVQLLTDEYISVAPAWVEGAPAELVSVLRLGQPV